MENLTTMCPGDNCPLKENCRRYDTKVAIQLWKNKFSNAMNSGDACQYYMEK